MSRKIDGSVSDWSGMLKDVFRQINDGSLTLENLKEFSNHRNPFKSLGDRIFTQVERQRIGQNYKLSV